MKNASTALKTYLATTRTFLMADLWTFTLVNGVVLRYTNADIGLNPGNFFTASDVLVEGAEINAQYGLEANNTDVTCYPSPNSVVGSTPFIQAAANGQFDRATVLKQRLFMPTWGDVTTLAPAVDLFIGQITGIEATRYTAKFSCKDAKNLLNIYMPRRQYQPTCAFTFGDSNCGFDRSSIAVNTTASAGSAQAILLATGLAQPAGYFNNGTVRFTSGGNAGLIRTIKNYNPGYVQLVAPFPVAAVAGDAFTITPGCTKSFAGPSVTAQGSVVNGSTPTLILNAIGSAPGTYNNNLLVFTSGGNNGLSRVIQSWNVNEAIMASPFPNSPVVGDTFNITTTAGVVLTSGSVANILSGSVIPSSVTYADGYFSGGTLAFTSGANAGQSQVITSWQDGIAYCAGSFGSVPALGDAFTLTSAAGSTQGTCTGYFGSNASLHFGGQRFIPVKETAY